MISDYLENKNLSLYQPPIEVQKFTKDAKHFYSKGNEILTKSWTELNDLSVLERDNRDKRSFNAYVDESITDPSEAWKWKGTRSEARKKAIGMFAHLTSGFMFPMVSAQDENNDEDRGVGEFMRDMIMWMGDNSDYRSSFLQLVLGIITSPVNYMGAEFAEIYQKVKTKTENGYTTKEALDMELSGFRAPIYGASDVLITNAYVQNIQKQTCVIKQRYLDYSDAQKKYGHHDNWDFVQKGINSVLNENDGLFYDVQDPTNADTVKETTLMWRGDDTEVTFLGGVYFGDDNIEYNPIKHRDNFNMPKYDVVPFGFYRISEHFFYYKSLMNTLYWEDALIDAMYANVMNDEFINQNLPIIISGDDKIDTKVNFPGAQVSTANPDARVQPIFPPSRSNGYQALQVIEKSMKESSISDTQTGQLPEASQKAFSVAKADQNAKIILKGVGQSIGESMIQYGKLMVDIAINHLSTPDIEEISPNSTRIKYRQFVLPKQISKGKSLDKILRFSGDIVGRKMSDKQKKEYELKLFEEAGKDKTIMAINPELASRMRYLIRIDPEEMFSENKEYTQKLLMQMYSVLRRDPLIDAETLTRKMLYSLFKTEADELMTEEDQLKTLKSQMIKLPKTDEEKISSKLPLKVGEL